MKKALITGVTGQDGSYLAVFLLEKGYEVHGIKRRSSLFNTQCVDHIYEDPHVERQRFKPNYGDLSDTSNVIRLLSEIDADEVYNLGAQSLIQAIGNSNTTRKDFVAEQIIAKRIVNELDEVKKQNDYAKFVRQ